MNNGYRANIHTEPQTQKMFIAFGGGVNSVATCVLLFSRGERYPIVFADTGAEHPYTYEYMEYFETVFLSKYFTQIIRLNPVTTPYYYRPQIRREPLYNYCKKHHLIPLVNQRFCTKDWKVSPCHKWAAEHGYARTIISFAYDERERAVQNETYPLIDEKITRAGCVSLIMKQGLKVPKKSGCYFCPFKQMRSWRETYHLYPHLYDSARRLEESFVVHCKSIGRKGHYLMHNQISLDSFSKLMNDDKDFKLPDPELDELIPCHCMY